MHEELNEYGFYVRSDGSFYAFVDASDIGFGEPVLKAEKKGQTKVYPFIGTASTPDKDREGDIVIQKGLNFAPFKEFGEFNWNHIPHAMTGVPTGKKAWFEEPGWRCQGEIISNLPIFDGYTTDMVVQQHNQLKKAGFNRGLCLSIEGKIQKRSGDGRFVAKADIYNIAHSFRPQNINCTVTMLAKSMMGKTPLLMRDRYYEKLDKALAVPAVKDFTKEDLEGGDDRTVSKEKLVKHLIKKGYSKSVAEKYSQKYLSGKFNLDK